VRDGSQEITNMQSLGNLARNKPTTGAACCPEYGGKKEENYESFI